MSNLDKMLDAFRADGKTTVQVDHDTIVGANAELLHMRTVAADRDWRFDGYKDLCALISDLVGEPFQSSLGDADRLLRKYVVDSGHEFSIEVELRRHAESEATALRAEVAKLRQIVREAHCALGASGGITEMDCSCEVCALEARL